MSSEKSKRSRAYPYLDLPEAWSHLGSAFEGSEDEALHRRTLAQKLGHQISDRAPLGGIAARKIAALVHYGFVECHTGEGTYSLSPLGIRALSAEPGSQEFRRLMQQAVYQPTMFLELLEKLRTQDQLPEDLEVTLVREFGIRPEASEKALGVFKNSLRFAELLGPGDRLMFGDRVCPSPQIEHQSAVSPHSLDSSEESISVLLTLSQKRQGWLTLVLPKDPSRQDLEMIRRQVELQLDLLPSHFENNVVTFPGQESKEPSQKLVD